jgi:hypothetical protein
MSPKIGLAADMNACNAFFWRIPCRCPSVGDRSLIKSYRETLTAESSPVRFAQKAENPSSQERRTMLISETQIDDKINNPASYGITKIRVLRARGKLPVNKQVGPTCGIYALDAAIRIQGIEVAPRNELWQLIVDAVNARKGIVMPNACAADDGAPAWSVRADGFAHWCL